MPHTTFFSLVHHKWSAFPQQMRFICVGSVNTGISYGVFILMLFLLGNASYQTALALTWAVCSISSFYLQKKWVFFTKGNSLQEYMRCLITWGIGYGLNVLILECLVKYFHSHIFIAQAIALFLVTCSTYILFKTFAFKK